MNLQGIGAAWFREQDWARWHELDPTIQPSFEAWRTGMEAAVAQHQAAGVAIIKVVIDPDTFIEWADARGMDYGSNTRKTYAALKATQADEQGVR